MKTRSPITTHILDTTKGKPAGNVKVILAKNVGANWQELATAKTNADGRIDNFLSAETQLQPATYKLQFFIKEYCQASMRDSFYSDIIICFEVKDPQQHYHIPLLFSGFGYTTYRGS